MAGPPFHAGAHRAILKVGKEGLVRLGRGDNSTANQSAHQGEQVGRHPRFKQASGTVYTNQFATCFHPPAVHTALKGWREQEAAALGRGPGERKI